MRNFKRQIESGLCGIYNLANALRDEDILNYENNKDLIPCGNPEIKKILKSEGYDFSIEPIVDSLSWKNKIPEDFFKQTILSFVDNTPQDELCNYVSVFILTVQVRDTEYDIHAVTLMYHKGRYAYSDPRDEEFQLLDSLDEVFDKCKYITAINAFCNDEGYVIWDGDKLECMEVFYETKECTLIC